MCGGVYEEEFEGMRMILLQCFETLEGGDFSATTVSEEVFSHHEELEFHIVNYVETEFPDAKYIHYYDENKLPACDLIIDGKINNRVLFERV